MSIHDEHRRWTNSEQTRIICDVCSYVDCDENCRDVEECDHVYYNEAFKADQQDADKYNAHLNSSRHKTPAELTRYQCPGCGSVFVE